MFGRLDALRLSLTGVVLRELVALEVGLSLIYECILFGELGSDSDCSELDSFKESYVICVWFIRDFISSMTVCAIEATSGKASLEYDVMAFHTVQYTLWMDVTDSAVELIG